MRTTSTLLVVAAIAGPLAFMGASVRASEIIVNGGFETGSLSPWFLGRAEYAANPGDTSNEWKVTTANPYAGAYSAVVNDNFELVQKFAPVAVGSIVNISFAAITAAGYMSVDLFYSNGVDEENIYSGSASAWRTFDVTPFLDSTQSSLVGISFWGDTYSYDFPGNPSYLDNVSIATTAPEASTWGMMIVGFSCLGFLGYRRNRAAAVA